MHELTGIAQKAIDAFKSSDLSNWGSMDVASRVAQHVGRKALRSGYDKKQLRDWISNEGHKTIFYGLSRIGKFSSSPRPTEYNTMSHAFHGFTNPGEDRFDVEELPPAGRLDAGKQRDLDSHAKDIMGVKEPLSSFSRFAPEDKRLHAAQTVGFQAGKSGYSQEDLHQWLWNTFSSVPGYSKLKSKAMDEHFRASSAERPVNRYSRLVAVNKSIVSYLNENLNFLLIKKSSRMYEGITGEKRVSCESKGNLPIVFGFGGGPVGNRERNGLEDAVHFERKGGKRVPFTYVTGSDVFRLHGSGPKEELMNSKLIGFFNRKPVFKAFGMDSNKEHYFYPKEASHMDNKFTHSMELRDYGTGDRRLTFIGNKLFPFKMSVSDSKKVKTVELTDPKKTEFHSYGE